MASTVAGRLSSTRQNWRTPQALFDQLHAEFGFTLDAAADKDNALTQEFFSARDNALWQRWTGIVWLNPPYHGNLPLFMQKAYLASREGATVCCLVPARTDTAWWHAYAMRAAELRFIVGRLQFDGCGTNAPFSSVLIVFRPDTDGPPRCSSYCIQTG